MERPRWRSTSAGPDVVEVTVYVPIDRPVEETGRVRAVRVPGGDFAVALHVHGSRDEDDTYGALGSYVAERGIGAAGPVREHCVPGGVEIWWPVTSTASV